MLRDPLATGWPDTLLDPMRQVGDPVADAAITMLFQNSDIQAVNHLMSTLVRNEELPPDALPIYIRDYLEQTAILPNWADMEKVRQSQALFSRFGPSIIVILNCSALPASYAAKKGVQVLYMTRRIANDIQTRLFETAQMIFDIMFTGGLEPGGRGVRSVQKVRLMHAAIRHLIQRSDSWNPENDLPINQEDMLGALLAFSYGTIVSLQKLGINLTEAEIEAYLHTWNVVGHLMGIQPDLLPATMTEAELLTKAIMARQFASSPEGQQMTLALIEWLDGMMPGTLFNGFASSMIRFFLGDEVANLLAVPAANWTKTLIRPIRFFSWASAEVGHIPTLARLTEVFGRKFVESLTWVDRGGQRPPFRIPTDLQEGWDVQPLTFS